MKRTNGTVAPLNIHFPKRACHQACCSRPFFEAVDYTLTDATAKIAEVLA